MAENLRALTEDRYQSLLKMERDYKAGILNRPQRQATKSRPAIGSRAVCLLEDIESMGTGRAILLSGSEHPYVFSARITGTPPVIINASDTFQVSINGQISPDIRIDATAQQMLLAVEQIAGIQKGSVSVRLGSFLEEPEDINTLRLPFRWFLEFDPGVFTDRPIVTATGGQSLFRARADQSFYRPQDIIDVHCVIPAGHPTPLRAGAIGTVDWFWNLGYGLTGIEPRRFDCGNGTYGQAVY